MGNHNIAIIVMAIAIVALTGIAVIAVFGPMMGNTGTGSSFSQNTISSTGTATLETVADEITINVRIETTGQTASQAQGWVEDTYDEVKENIDEYLGDAEVETSQISVNKWYEWENKKNVFKGYRAVYSVRITLEDPETAAKIIDGVAEGGGMVDYVNFGLSKEKQKELKKQALVEASQDAKTKAEAIAEGLGGRLGGIVSVSMSDFNYPMPRYAMAEMAVMSGGAGDEMQKSIDIPPQKLDVSANVNVVYRIK